MSGQLTTEAEPNHETLWRYLRQLLERVFGVLESESVVDDCLDVLLDVLGADRGLILITYADGSTQAVNARAKKRTLEAVEREEISRSIIRDALESSRCVVWSALTADPSSSMNTLGILTAFAAPLHVPGAGKGGRRAVLYVDFRQYRKHVGERHVEFFMAAALLLGSVFEQAALTDRLRDHLREAESHCVVSRSTPPLDELLGSPSLAHLRNEVESGLHGDSSILILGESGTGKTLIAQAIAEASGKRPIVRAVLGSSDDLNTITSELFGHERGAYSGATQRRAGLVEFADGGTLILDELLNLRPHAQKLLLDFTQFGTYRPLGYEKAEPKRAKVRIIGATNGDLLGAIREGRFRLDLYHRLAGVVLELPPLRERREDIPVLAERTLARLDRERSWTLSLGLRRLLLAPCVAWSGNVRQLERVLTRARERALSRDSEASVLTPEHLDARDLDGLTIYDSASARDTLPAPESLGVAWQRLQAEREQLEQREQRVIRQALSAASGVVAKAARELGIARTTLASRIEAVGMRKAPNLMEEA